MTSFPCRRMKFSEIREKLPHDCWARWRDKRHQGEFEDEDVLYHPSSLRLPALDLGQPAGPDETPLLILVEGDLAVDGHIYSQDTDGACGLVVLGNLSARNMVVGGQEIYVTGDLAVAELCWGDYNHGTLKVQGNASAAVLADTEEYHLEVAGAIQARRRISQWDEVGDWCDLDGRVLQDIFVPDCILDGEDGPILWREKMREHFEAGRAVVRLDRLDAPAAPPAMASLFPDRQLTIANIERLTAPALLPEAVKPGLARRYEFWAGELFCRASADQDDGEPHPLRTVYFQDGSEKAVSIRVGAEPPRRGLWARLRGAQGRAWRIAAKARSMTGADTEWHPLDSLGTGPFAPLIQQGWNQLLDGASAYAHARTLIDPARLRALLALPLAEPYDDFYDDDRNGLWAGSVYCAFRQDGAPFDGEPMPALLRVSAEAAGRGGEVGHYFFELQRHLDGSECVRIDHKPGEDQDRVCLSYVGDAASLGRAARFFDTAERNLVRANAQLLAGEPPNRDDGFALAHWRGKGYLSGRLKQVPGAQ